MPAPRSRPTPPSRPTAMVVRAGVDGSSLSSCCASVAAEEVRLGHPQAVQDVVQPIGQIGLTADRRGLHAASGRAHRVRGVDDPVPAEQLDDRIPPRRRASRRMQHHQRDARPSARAADPSLAESRRDVELLVGDGHLLPTTSSYLVTKRSASSGVRNVLTLSGMGDSSRFCTVVL